MFTRAVILAALATFLIALAHGTHAQTQPPPNEPPTPQPAATAPLPADNQKTGEPVADPPQKKPEPDKAAPLAALVTALGGTVDRADKGVSASATEGWTPVKAGDSLPPGTQIRTGPRSFVDLRFGESTYISIRTATYASIDEFYRSATTEVVRLGLGYGKVRGGSFEGTVRGDVIVDTPTATLAKRGTDGWEIEVEAGTGRFRQALSNEGLVVAIQRVRGEEAASRTIRPGEYATENTIASLWIKQDIFDRNVTFFEPPWVTTADAAYSNEHTTGMSVVAPGMGAGAWGYGVRGDSAWVRQQIDQSFNPAVAALPGGARPPFVILPPIGRLEGNFGTKR